MPRFGQLFLVILFSLSMCTNSTTQTTTYHSLGYSDTEVTYLKSIYQDDIDLIVKYQIKRDDLFIYLDIDSLTLDEIIKSEEIRKTSNITHLAALNLYHHPFIIKEFYKYPQPALNRDSYLILVNKNYFLDETYKPHDLVLAKDAYQLINDESRYYLRKAAYEAYLELQQEAKKHDLYIYLSNGYRSYQKQEKIYNDYLLNGGNADLYSARPGYSEHQTGLALDITCAANNFLLTESFALTAEGQFVKENAYRFGFIIRYPKDKEHLTGYMYEPWHLRYVGKEVAKIIHEQNLTLEEYLINYTYIKKQ